jgi:branched-chain amino acid aminotransferase group I
MQPTSITPENRDLWVYVGGELVTRDQARVSVFDSVVQGGDAVWEGLRVYAGRIFRLDEHLDRLRDSARAMAFVDVPGRDEVKRAIFTTLEANGMRDGAHVRLTLTRGTKVTSGMDPRLNRSGPCLIVLAEWKPPIYPATGIRLVTASVRRNSPQCLDSRIHHNNLINNILAKLEANAAGADDALMLDLSGFVSETNATNVFLVKGGVLSTPRADQCLPGITRRTVLEIAAEDGLPARERNLTLADVYSADEMFTTGTMGELAPVLEVDGRGIGDGSRGPVTGRLQVLYAELTAREGEPLPF